MALGPEQFPVPARMWPWWPAQGKRPSQIRIPVRAGSGRFSRFTLFMGLEAEFRRTETTGHLPPPLSPFLATLLEET